jgi:hypothetical protein
VIDTEKRKTADGPRALFFLDLAAEGKATNNCYCKPAASFALDRTSRSMAGVRRPVNVFCCETW